MGVSLACSPTSDEEDTQDSLFVGDETGEGDTGEDDEVEGGNEGGEGDDGDGEDEGDGDGGSGASINCDNLNDPGFVTPTLGGGVPHFESVDANSNEVGLCDFAGKPILMDYSTLWCGVCKGWGWYFHASDAEAMGFPEEDDWGMGPLRKAIQAGDVEWVTIIVEGNNSGTPATQADLIAWESEVGSTYGVTILEKDKQMSSLRQEGGYPGWALISPDFEWEAFEGIVGGIGAPMEIAIEKYCD